MTDKRINYSLSEVFGELRNVVLEENGEDKMVSLSIEHKYLP